MTTDKKVTLQVRMPAALYEKAKERAKAANMGLSEWIRRRIEGAPPDLTAPPKPTTPARPDWLKRLRDLADRLIAVMFNSRK